MPYILLFLVYIFVTPLFAQKHDYVWVMGTQNLPVVPGYGGSILDFKETPAIPTYHFRPMNFRACNASICDTAGNLVLYTNGCAIAGADDAIVDNGDNINPGFVHDWKCNEQYIESYPSGYQSVLFLPTPLSQQQYYLFHKRVAVSFNPFVATSDKLYYSIIDMEQNNGSGKVVAKNVELMNGPVSYGDITAVKHANGIDWWIVTAKDQSTQFYFFLLTKDGIVDTLTQHSGIPYGPNSEAGGQVVFSPDGSTMFRANPDFGVNIFGFDRALGQFTSFDTFQIRFSYWEGQLWDPVSIYCGVSPNGRYLYVSCELWVYQYDLWADDIGASQVTVAEWDGFQDPIGITFGVCQLGPDCKMYISSIDSRYYHIIHHPDVGGLGCDVEQHGLVFPTPTGASIPTFPNYRLGPLGDTGLPCSSVVSGNGQAVVPPLPALSVFPNPASDHLVLVLNRYGLEAAQWQLYDVQGRRMRQQEISGVQGQDRYEVDLQGLAAGVYFYTLRTGTGLIQSGKVLVK
jgi:hypothetical protein